MKIIITTFILTLILINPCNANEKNFEIFSDTNWINESVQSNKIDNISLSTTSIELFNSNNNFIAKGTGFFFVTEKDEPQLFLVTNKHNLLTPAKKPLEKLTFYCHKDPSKPEDIKFITLPLITKKKETTWILNKEHPDTDIAVIPIPDDFLTDCKIFAISEKWTQTDLKLRPATDIVLVGYPQGNYNDENRLPLWKKGSIASDPSIDIFGKPAFIIDISAYKGNSGSPIFATAYGAYETEDGIIKIGTVRKFLGIYSASGAIDEELNFVDKKTGKNIKLKSTQALDLGFVWKAKELLNIINSIDYAEYEKRF